MIRHSHKMWSFFPFWKWGKNNGKKCKFDCLDVFWILIYMNITANKQIPFRISSAGLICIPSNSNRENNCKIFLGNSAIILPNLNADFLSPKNYVFFNMFLNLITMDCFLIYVLIAKTKIYRCSLSTISRKGKWGQIVTQLEMNEFLVPIMLNGLLKEEMMVQIGLYYMNMTKMSSILFYQMVHRQLLKLILKIKKKKKVFPISQICLFKEHIW